MFVESYTHYSNSFPELLSSTAQGLLDLLSQEEDVRKACDILHEVIISGIRTLMYYFHIEDRPLDQAVLYLEDVLGEWVRDAWEMSLVLHYDGSLEGNIYEEDLPIYVERVKDFIGTVREAVI